MPLSKKQVKQLRGMANSLNPLIQIGRNEVSDSAVEQADAIIEQRELVKCTVLDGCMLEPKDAAAQLAERLDAEVVQVIGNRFILFRRSHRKDIEHIRLVRE